MGEVPRGEVQEQQGPQDTYVEGIRKNKNPKESRNSIFSSGVLAAGVHSQRIRGEIDWASAMASYRTSEAGRGEEGRSRVCCRGVKSRVGFQQGSLGTEEGLERGAGPRAEETVRRRSFGCVRKAKPHHECLRR